ncbi:hypothetical protein ACWGSE_23930 [Streptomyces diastaticus]|uniref:hypothetical protein n=1 Tax=Streptomyces TaxID=1883 RepID=UPI000C25E037|nr:MULTISPECIES: hypothetical protein [unclassified Streptomyces]MBL3806996.1 hypothetical protein [Streptomyces sp. BRB081]PJM80690.1 hypothetical protein CH313_27330 [Streptomyces sp. TSRI0384-2]RPK79952.1 hypothetical protein EES47_28960 [Streptomyces sp. ADI98-12]
MTITFTAATAPAAGFVVTCGCDEATVRAEHIDNYDAAQAAADQTNAAPDQRRPLPGCSIPTVCPDYPLRAEPIDPDGIAPLINVSNVNAVALLDALGLPSQSEAPDCQDLEPFPAKAPDNGMTTPITVVDAYGDLPAEEFLGRVLTALGLAPKTWAHRTSSSAVCTWAAARPDFSNSACETYTNSLPGARRTNAASSGTDRELLQSGRPPPTCEPHSLFPQVDSHPVRL